jgi:hypothetical protein
MIFRTKEMRMASMLPKFEESTEATNQTPKIHADSQTSSPDVFYGPR